MTSEVVAYSPAATACWTRVTRVGKVRVARVGGGFYRFCCAIINK